ncbi:MAG TPA: isoprenylcysteine carboxylmethyltransferase family protein [Vicinamibacterales bacterium]|nr:isoprenylcysteine carboxylmethyltransferase family protein [Vicinamibacterales bacterium]
MADGSPRITEALARRRVPLGYALALLAFWLADPTPRSLAIGAALAAAGEALRIWAAGHLEKGREVTTSGPYAFTRHPLYAGSAVMGAGFAVASNSIAAAAVVIAYLAATITAAIRSEEAHLTDKFGERYPAYRQGAAAPEPRRFSAARAVRNREYRALLGVLGTFALLAAKLFL